jgi:flavin reductase (DIM6/NTAB) family NADH-FMN oxidoreductase RutF
MSIDQSAVDRMVFALRPPVIAVTTHFEGRDNGQIVLSGQAGSIIPDAMRMSVNICKPNFTHDLVMQSGVFALHLLRSDSEEALANSLGIVKALGGHSGHNGYKMGGLSIKRGVTGAPILSDTLMVVECRVAKAFDCDEMTYFLGDVVGCEKMAGGMPLDVAQLWSTLPKEWVEDYEHRHTSGLMATARKARGLA